MSEDDKYPAESGRRRFVKGVVGGGALAGVGATGSATINSLTTSSGTGGGQTTAMAIERVGGPAPRGMPQIPVEITDDGYIRGKWPETATETQEGQEITVAKEEMPGGVTYSGEWFQYCGIESYQGIQPEFESDNIFKSAAGGYDWQGNAYENGDPIHRDDFEDYTEWGNGIGADGVGKPALATWRSEDTDSSITAVVLRSPRVEEAAQDDEWLQASTEDGFMAWVNVCTHFCCIPGYKKNEESARYDAANGVYCQCHQSVYDPFSIVETLFVARPRTD
ncbi:ubiquinol-cytochrome c reductase iron-sulfur subunit [Haloparvum alkalitolerans]|uniref:ubiquinol-cytochrome c reductase iron-sulfur subunit n=1 Tax=Haloparvum alkalitolerans TaxID=1042953 RepID=UPI003CF91E86